MQRNAAPLRVAAYCRVSTDREDQANSLQSQRTYFAAYIQQHQGWRLTEVFADATVIIGLNQQSLGVQGVAPV